MSSNRQLFLRHLAQTTDSPLLLEVEKAEGIYLITPKGEKIIDLISGIAVSNLGHNHPAVVQAVKEQAEKHLHVMVYGELVQSPQVALAKALLNTLPETLNNVYFVSSGSEAVEGAVKIAKRYTGRPDVVACVDAYHGSTQGALSLSGNETLKQAYRPLIPGVKLVRFGNIDDLENITELTSAVIIEVVQGEAGVRLASDEYFKALRRRCTQKGTLLIFDEIQTGFGRTGTFWAFEQYDCIPDILLTAKGMGGGMPIGAFISKREIMYTLTNNPMLGHITTFGGHPVSAAASLATLNELRKGDLMEQVNEKSEMIFDLLNQLPLVREIRKKGLMIAVEFDSFDLLQKIIRKLLEAGVLSDWFLFCDKSMRIAPPLIITKREIEIACEKIGRILKQF